MQTRSPPAVQGHDRTSAAPPEQSCVNNLNHRNTAKRAICDRGGESIFTFHYRDNQKGTDGGKKGRDE